MLELFEVIDEAQAEQMLEQHGRYQFGKISVVRRKSADGVHVGWYVYYGPLEVHCLEDAEAEPQRFFRLAEALECALSPANQERWEELWKEREGAAA